MDTDRNPPEEEMSSPRLAGSAPAAGWVRLPGPGDAAAESRRARRDGVRHVRRMSNWTAAPVPAITNGAGGPQVSHPVATTSGSGVAVTTQTQTVNGKTVVTQVPRAASPGS